MLDGEKQFDDFISKKWIRIRDDEILETGFRWLWRMYQAQMRVSDVNTFEHLCPKKCLHIVK